MLSGCLRYRLRLPQRVHSRKDRPGQTYSATPTLQPPHMRARTPRTLAHALCKADGAGQYVTASKLYNHFPPPITDPQARPLKHYMLSYARRSLSYCSSITVRTSFGVGSSPYTRILSSDRMFRGGTELHRVSEHNLFRCHSRVIMGFGPTTYSSSPSATAGNCPHSAIATVFCVRLDLTL